MASFEEKEFRRAYRRHRGEVDRETERSERSVYISPLPMATEIDDVYELVDSQSDVRIVSIKLNRRAMSRAFAGSAYVELANAQEAEDIVTDGLLLPSGEELQVTLRAVHEAIKIKAQKAKRKAKAKEEAARRKSASASNNYL